MRFLLSPLLLLVLLAPPSLSSSVSGPRVLAILDKVAFQSIFTKFFASLTERGFKVDYTEASDAKLKLISNGELAYDHLLLWSPKVSQFGNGVKFPELIEFMNKGGNIMMAASSSLGDTLRDFAFEFSADFDDKNTAVIDHFAFDTKLDSKGKHTVVYSDSANLARNSVILSDAVLNGPPILFKGIGHKLTGRNQLAMKVLGTGPSAYSYDVEDEEISAAPMINGAEMALVSVLQARNNARIAFCGSLEMFSDLYIDSPVTTPKKKHEKSGNWGFITELSKWVFHEKGVLRLDSSKHHKKNESDQLEMYRVKDEIVYDLVLSQWTGSSWSPVKFTDLQLEAVMLDPYIRTTFTPQPPTKTATPYKVEVMLPDVYGVFTLKIAHYRQGYTYLEHNELISIRALRHDEYDRFLVVAWPYYASSFSMMAAFWVVCCLMLFNKDHVVAKKDKPKTQ